MALLPCATDFPPPTRALIAKPAAILVLCRRLVTRSGAGPGPRTIEFPLRGKPARIIVAPDWWTCR
jgi:hypothetical protein